MRGGLFSLRRLPRTQAERAEEAARRPLQRNITKLGLESDSSRK